MGSTKKMEEAGPTGGKNHEKTDIGIDTAKKTTFR